MTPNQIQDELNQRRIRNKIRNEQGINNLKMRFYYIIYDHLGKMLFFGILMLFGFIAIGVYQFFQLDNGTRWQVIVNIAVFIFGWLTRFIRTAPPEILQNDQQ